MKALLGKRKTVRDKRATVHLQVHLMFILRRSQVCCRALSAGQDSMKQIQTICYQ